MPILSLLHWFLQVQRLPGWFKQRDNYFYPAWAYVFPTTVLRIPYSLTVAVMWSGVTYYTVGLAPEASRYPWRTANRCPRPFVAAELRDEQDPRHSRTLLLLCNVLIDGVHVVALVERTHTFRSPWRCQRLLIMMLAWCGCGGSRAHA